MKLLEFIFQSVWHFLGFAFLLGIVSRTLAYITVYTVYILKTGQLPKQKTDGE